jgi:pilus assembly protein Flp/PilA
MVEDIGVFLPYPGAASMSKFIAAAKGFVKGEEGATMVEYAIMVALIAVVCIAVVTALGTQVFNVFDTVQSEMADVSTVAPKDPVK